MTALRAVLAIIGAGMAGLAAAVAAAARGVRVTLIDAGDAPGGQATLQTHIYGDTGLRGYELGPRLWQEAARHGVTLLPRTVAWGLFEDRTLGLALDHDTDDERGTLLHADSVLVATGAIDRTPVFPGATLPGVMTATAAMTMLHRWRVRPGVVAVVVGDDPITALVARYATEAGIPTRVVPSVASLRLTTNQAGALEHINRENGVSSGMPALILAAGMQPACELARMVECELIYSEPLGGWVPMRDMGMRTSIPWLFVAGDAAGVGDAGSAMAQGRIAGNAIADMLGKATREPASLPFTLVPGAFRQHAATVWDAVRATTEVAR